MNTETHHKTVQRLSRHCSLLLLLFAAAVFASCSSSQEAVSEAKYRRTCSTIADNMLSYGYQLSGHQRKEDAAGQGISEAFYFADSLGAQSSYSVSYTYGETSTGAVYIENMDVTGCRTDRAEDYSDICRGPYSPDYLLTTMSPDMKYRYFDEKKTDNVFFVLDILRFIGELLGSL